LQALREMRHAGGYSFAIGVDGGIASGTIAAAAAAGAERFVAGSAVIRSGDYAAAIQRLEKLAREAA
ncbi:MAG: ribulose-phosphate 3-epimerase, partial [Planctomycetaceae bacterium]